MGRLHMRLSPHPGDGALYAVLRARDQCPSDKPNPARAAHRLMSKMRFCQRPPRSGMPKLFRCRIIKVSIMRIRLRRNSCFFHWGSFRDRVVAFLLFMLVWMWCVSAHAQTAGTVTITSTPTMGNGVINTTVTWSSSPAATSCALTGGGIANPTAAVSGTVSDTITKKTTYAVACNWTRTNNVLHWDTPATNSDGSPLTDLVSYTIWYNLVGQTSSLSQKVLAPATSATITPSVPGTYAYAIQAINSAGLSSLISPSIIGPPIGTTTATATATTTVTPIPSPVTGLTVQ